LPPSFLVQEVGNVLSLGFTGNMFPFYSAEVIGLDANEEEDMERLNGIYFF
jgi:hypothetical protein